MVKTREFIHEPTYKQFICLELLYDRVTKYPLFGGGAGGGKSWLGCEWIASMCLNFPGVRYFMGREEKARLKDTTVKTFMKMSKHHKIHDTFIYYEHYGTIKFHNGSEISLLELKFTPSDPMYERFGSTEYTGGFIEEAGEIHFNAFDALKVRVGRQLNEKYDIPKKILITCNPKKNWLYHTFYKPFTKGELPPGYAFVQSLAIENEKIDKGYVEGLDEITDPTTKKRLKYGEWEYEDDPLSLIPYDQILDIFTSDFVPPGKKYITADIARFGKDKIIIRVWDGLRCIKRIQREKLAITDTATLIKTTASEHKIPMSQVIVDEDGVGGGVVDILKCKGFVALSRPLKGEKFDHLKSQCGYKLADLIKENKIYEVCENPALKESIIEELGQLKRKSASEDRVQAIMEKDKIKDLIGRSPDDLDTFIMRAWFEIQPSGTSSSGAW